MLAASRARPSPTASPPGGWRRPSVQDRWPLLAPSAVPADLLAALPSLASGPHRRDARSSPAGYPAAPADTLATSAGPFAAPTGPRREAPRATTIPRLLTHGPQRGPAGGNEAGAASLHRRRSREARLFARQLATGGPDLHPSGVTDGDGDPPR